MRHTRAYIKITAAYLLAAAWMAFAILTLIYNGTMAARSAAAIAPLASALVLTKSWLELKAINVIINALPPLLWLSFCDKHTPVTTGMIFLLSLLLLAFGLIDNLVAHSKARTQPIA